MILAPVASGRGGDCDPLDAGAGMGLVFGRGR
jgi:hypothetical protein